MEIANQTHQLCASAGTLSNLDCLNAFEPIQDPIYANTTNKAVRG
ncbi:hypothetical protein ABFA25_00020 [Mycobacterium lepromatosis]